MRALLCGLLVVVAINVCARHVGASRDGRQLSATEVGPHSSSLADQAPTAALSPLLQRLGPYVKSIVYGGLDGIVTTFAIVSGVEGAQMSPRITLILGTSNLVADAVSMAFGDYLSTRAELVRRESLWQTASLGTDQKASLKASYIAHGLSEADASQTVSLLSRSESALRHAIMAELNVGRPESVDAVWNGFVTLVSFISFGSVPLLGYTAAIQRTGLLAKSSPFVRAICLTAVTLFALGAFESWVTGQSMAISGIQTLFTGEVAAALAYFLGKLSSDLLVAPQTPQQTRRGSRKD